MDFPRQEELFPDGPAETLIPLTRLVLEVIYWARQAPEIKPGRKVQGAHSPHPIIMGARLSVDQKISPDAYTDEEILTTVPARKRHGHGTRTLEARDQNILEIEDLTRPRKVPRAGKHSA